MHLFTYGSLMFEQVWSRLAQGHYVRRPARLHGFARRNVRHDVYPVVFRSQDSDWVDGMIYLDITKEDINRLDHFEGQFYDRREHMIIVEGSERITAAVYVLKDHYDHIISGDEWDPARFTREGLAVFLGQYQGF
ncbi:MAG: gamma-glutamylcyclotransferase [Phycisphaerales bacterium]|nr:MAG: gamma-glutamylcyclotransferase [Phycisphaerales bacterium]